MSDGGIALPEEAQRVEISGVVVGVGEEVPTTNDNGDPISRLKEGDRVIFAQHAGTEITLEDDKGEEIVVLIMSYKNAQALIEEEA